jgi:hypothetical protein
MKDIGILLSFLDYGFDKKLRSIKAVKINFLKKLSFLD